MEFTCSNSHAFPSLISSSSSLSSLRVLEKELKFGSAADENYYSGEREGVKGSNMPENLKNNLATIRICDDHFCRNLEAPSNNVSQIGF